MKKMLLLSVISLFSVLVWGQKCFYEINEIDEFTGKVKIRTASINLPSAKESRKTRAAIGINLNRNGQDYYLQAFAVTKKVVFIGPKSKFYLKLCNDSVITLVTNELNLKPIPIEYGCFNSINNYKISLKDLAKIRKYGLKKVRMETTEGNVESNTSESSRPLVTHIIDCLYEASAQYGTGVEAE